MTDTLQAAKTTLLDPTGINVHDLDGLIGRLMAYDIDYADLYFQYSQSESWSLEDGAVKSGSRSIDQGVGIRAISGEKTGFAYSDELHLPALWSQGFHRGEVPVTVTKKSRNNWYQMKLRQLREENARLKQEQVLCPHCNGAR